jgi:hypothetical protein
METLQAKKGDANLYQQKHIETSCLMLVHTLSQSGTDELHFRRQLLQWHAFNDGWVPQMLLMC